MRNALWQTDLGMSSLPCRGATKFLRWRHEAGIDNLQMGKQSRWRSDALETQMRYRKQVMCTKLQRKSSSDSTDPFHFCFFICSSARFIFANRAQERKVNLCMHTSLPLVYQARYGDPTPRYYAPDLILAATQLTFYQQCLPQVCFLLLYSIVWQYYQRWCFSFTLSWVQSR